MLLFYDCETTGIPDFKARSNDPSQPHILQLAGELHDDARQVVKSMDRIIRPDGWVVPQNIAELTGITQEKAMDLGVPIREAVDEFLALHGQCRHTVAHNDSFDRWMLRIELIRLGMDAVADRWKEAPAFCTCKAATPVCNLPPTEKMIATGRRTPKSPKLEEAFRFFMGHEPESAYHDAMNDVHATAAIFYRLQELGFAGGKAAA